MNPTQEQLEKLSTYNRPTNGLAYVRELERLLKLSLESRPVDGGSDKLATAARQADKAWRAAEEKIAANSGHPVDYESPQAGEVLGVPGAGTPPPDGARLSEEPIRNSSPECNRPPKMQPGSENATGSTFGTPPHLIPEGAVEFESERMRALRWDDSEVRVVSSGEWQCRMDDEWAATFGENDMSPGNGFEDVHPWLRHHMALYPYTGEGEKPVCTHCNDTHSVSFEDDRGEWRTQNCNHCPVPCQRCRAGGNGPYCQETPCSCDCHKKAKPSLDTPQETEPGDALDSVDQERLEEIRTTVSVMQSRVDGGESPGASSARLSLSMSRDLLQIFDAVILSERARNAKRVAELESKLKTAEKDVKVLTDMMSNSEQMDVIALLNTQKTELEKQLAEERARMGVAAANENKLHGHISRLESTVTKLESQLEEAGKLEEGRAKSDLERAHKVTALVDELVAVKSERDTLRRERDESRERVSTLERFAEELGTLGYFDPGSDADTVILQAKEVIPSLRRRAETAESERDEARAEVTRWQKIVDVRNRQLEDAGDAFKSDVASITKRAETAESQLAEVTRRFSELHAWTMDHLRKEVMWFARWMEVKLRENDHKGGWRDCDPNELQMRAEEELSELDEALGYLDHGEPEAVENVVREAADVANMVMMVADNASENELPEPTEPKEKES